LSENSIEVYELPKKLVRCDATTVSGYHKVVEENPCHPGLRIERITNDPTAWSARVDKRCRISFELMAFLPTGSPDWTSQLKPLRILDHDDLYKTPR